MGKPRHKEGDFATFANEMLVNPSKLSHFLEIDPHFVDRDEPVSYTHLDVYKRQNQRFPSDPQPTRTKRSPAGNDRRASLCASCRDRATLPLQNGGLKGKAGLHQPDR